MTTGATDADLVEAHLAGDRGALAAIYDRYAAALHDTATYLLGDRDEATSTTWCRTPSWRRQSTSPSFATRRGCVPGCSRWRATRSSGAAGAAGGRCRPRRWLRWRRPPRWISARASTPASSPPPCGPRRQGSTSATNSSSSCAGARVWKGADLAAALGVSPAQSYSLVFRMRERVSRSLGALLVARVGRRDCPELAALLQGWDGTFSVLIRKRVARHVDRCDVCERTKARVALPALFAAAPVMALPADLRDRVLAAVGGGGTGPPMSFDGAGFPVAKGPRTPIRRPGRRAAVVAAIVAAAVVVGGAVVLVRRGPADVVTVEAPSPAASSPALGPTSSSAPSTTLTAATSAASPPPTTTTTSSTQAAASTTMAPTAPPTVATTASRLVLPPETPPTRPTIPPVPPIPDEDAEAPLVRAVFADPAIFVGGCAPRATTVTVTASDESAVDVERAVAGPDRILRPVDAEPATLSLARCFGHFDDQPRLAKVLVRASAL